MKKIFCPLFAVLMTLGFTQTSAQEKEKEEGDSTRTKKSSIEIKQTKEGTSLEYKSGSDSVVIPMDGGRLTIKFHEDSTLKKKPKKKKPSKYNRDFWAGLDIGVNNYIDPAGGAMIVPSGFAQYELNQANSIHLGFNLFEKQIPIYKHHVVLLTGLGFDFNNYSFDSRQYVFDQPDSNGIVMERDYRNNRLRTYHATIPLMLGLDFSKPGKNGLHIAAGVVGGVRFASSTKEKYDTEDGTVVRKVRDDFDLNPFQVNAQARVGYGDFTVFANYSLTPMFKNSADRPQLYPVSLGISFGG